MQVQPFKDQKTFISKEYLTLEMEDILNIQNNKTTKQPKTNTVYFNKKCLNTTKNNK